MLRIDFLFVGIFFFLNSLLANQSFFHNNYNSDAHHNPTVISLRDSNLSTLFANEPAERRREAGEVAAL